jgi:hypothetical protein
MFLLLPVETQTTMTQWANHIHFNAFRLFPKRWNTFKIKKGFYIRQSSVKRKDKSTGNDLFEFDPSIAVDGLEQEKKKKQQFSGTPLDESSNSSATPNV